MVLKLVLMGAEFADLKEYARENLWGLTAEQLHQTLEAIAKLPEDEQPAAAVAHAIGQGWRPGLSPGQVRRYQAHALNTCARQSFDRKKSNLGRHILQRRALYARAMESGDWRTALAIARDEAILQDLYPSARHELTIEDKTPVPVLTEEERVIRIAALLESVRAREAGSLDHGPAAESE